MHYDQDARRVLGYQHSTGRVFVQGNGDPRVTRVLHANGVLILVPHTADQRRVAQSGVCTLLELTGDGVRWTDQPTSASVGQVNGTFVSHRKNTSV